MVLPIAPIVAVYLLFGFADPFCESALSDLLARLLTGQSIVNLGFALFAFDALILSWLATYSSGEDRLSMEGRWINSRLDDHLHAFASHIGKGKDHPSSAVQADEMAVAQMGPHRETVDEFLHYAQNRKSGRRLRRAGWGLGLIDVAYFVLASAVRDLSIGNSPASQHCEYTILIAAVVLAFLHLVLGVFVYIAWRRSIRKKRHAREAISKIQIILRLRGVPVEGGSSDLEVIGRF